MRHTLMHTHTHTLIIAPPQLDSLLPSPSRVAEKDGVKAEQEHSTHHEERGLW